MVCVYVPMWQFGYEKCAIFLIIPNKNVIFVVYQTKNHIVMEEIQETEKKTINISWRVSKYVDELKAKFKSLNSKETTEEILTAYFVTLPTLQKEVEQLRANNGCNVSNEQLECLQKENNDLKDSLEASKKVSVSYSETIDAMAEKIKVLEVTKEQQTNTITELNQRLNEIDGARAINLKIDNEIVWELLQAVKTNLCKRYNRDVSFYEIFVNTTLQYNVEKRCAWFYPYLSDEQIVRISNKSIREWKSFLSQKN